MGRGHRTVVVGGLVACLAGVQGHAQNRPSPEAPPPAPAQATPAAGTQDPAAQGEPQQPIFRAGINFVRVDAIVTGRDGRPVTDLEAADFEVTEDGRPQTIETFKRVDLDGGLMPGPDGPPRVIRSEYDEEAEAARDDVRLFGVFLDDYHVRRETSMGAREELSRFVETQLGPSDMLTLMYPLQPLDSVRFTRDHAAIRRGLMQFEGRKYDYEPRNQFEYTYSNQPTEIVERIRNQVSLSAVEALIVRMGSLKEGRKALILVSEGYSNYVPPQLRSRTAGMPDFDNPARGDPLAGTNSPIEERAQFFAGADLELDLREVYAAANRHNVAIYALDPRGLAASEFGIDQNVGPDLDRSFLNATLDTLRTLAIETDGRAIVGRNDLVIAMKQIVLDSSSYYLLGYSSSEAPTDGKFHEIKVRVRRPGVQVRARNGYWAITSADAARIDAPPRPGPPAEVQAALSSLSAPSRSRVIRTWIGTDRGERGKTRVTFLWEAMPPTPGAPPRPGDRPDRVALTAAGADGTPHFRGRVAAAAGATASLVTFEVPPGPLRLRLTVENADADVIDSEQRDIDVPDLTAPRPLLSTPVVFRARTVRELEQIKGDPSAQPTAQREFRRTERILVRVSAYGAGGTTPEVAVRLLNRTGDSMMDLPVAPQPVSSLSVEVPLASLPPGEYLVEFVARSGGEQLKELLGFRVTG